MSRRTVAVFEDDHALLLAVRDARKLGCEISEVLSPHPVHGLDDVMGIRKSRLPWVTLAAGLAGLGLGTWLEYWTSATDWPINVGGKPFDSFPAFVPVMFELTVLAAGVATFVFVLGRSGLRPGKAVQLTEPRTTDDRFALYINHKEGMPGKVELHGLLRGHGAVACREEDC